MFIEKTEMIFHNTSRICRQMHEQMKSGKRGDFPDFYVEATMRPIYGGRESSILRIEDGSGSDYCEMADILETYYARTPSSLWPMSKYFLFRHDETLDDKFFQEHFGHDHAGNMRLDTTWHHWLGVKFPQLLEVPVCHALYNLFDRTGYSLPDIIRINEVLSEVRVSCISKTPIIDEL
jgi:hypothetical protein